MTKPLLPKWNSRIKGPLQGSVDPICERRVFVGFVIWTAIVMGAFVSHAGGHIINMLVEFGVL